jgi:hypothetical protein
MAGIDPNDSDLPTSSDLVLDGSGALRGRRAEGTQHSLGRMDIRNCLDPKESIRGSDYNQILNRSARAILMSLAHTIAVPTCNTRQPGVLISRSRKMVHT